MHCASCGFENPKDIKFCGQCAAALSRPCARCGFENPSEFAFCGQCGAALGTEPKEKASPDAERRHLTVMFCDQVDSVGRSARLDPEELREITHQYQEMCAKVIQHFGGHIAQYQGDGLLVYFGYPLAHEDDAQRAVRAGLGILAELPHLNARLQRTMKDIQDFPLELRIGIHTGLAVLGEMGTGERRELIAFGEAPNLASRLQNIAAPNTVIISADTYHLTRGFVECRDLGPQQLKGVSRPVQVYQVLRESGIRSRFEASTAAGLTPLVGRKEELGLLLERWEQVKEGEGRVVLLSGEAGIGKSRLMQALKDHLATESPLWLEFQCSPYHQNSALYLVIDLLQRLLRFERVDSPQEKFSKLETFLEGFTLSLLEIMPLFASLLSLPLPDHYPSLTLTPQRQRQKLQEAVVTLLAAQTERQPVLLVIEDLHWADPSTLEMLSFFVSHGAVARSLTLLTFRPEFSPPWGARSHIAHLTLNRLSHKQVEAMIIQVTKGKTLPAEVMHQLITKTDGVPLFVEELTKMVLESGLLKEEVDHYTLTGPLLPFGIPATLHDSLTARLDRLGPVKEVAQLGATVGREFPYELLQAVSSLTEAALQRALDQLVEAELLYRRRQPSQELYVFKHALIQETAYQSLLKSTRQRFHSKIAQVLEARFPDITETQPELLAHHYTEAGLATQAIPYWQRAGQRASQRSAPLEGINHLTKGLELLKLLPDTPERTRQELRLQYALGTALIITKGAAAPEVERVYTRAQALCQQLGETPYHFWVMLRLWNSSANRVQPQTPREHAEQLLPLPQKGRDLTTRLPNFLTRGMTSFFLGELVPAREQLEQGIVLYVPRPHRSAFYEIACLAHVAQALWYLGYPDQALKRSGEALALAQEVAHPYSLAFARHWAAGLHRLRGEIQAAQRQAEALLALSTKQGLLGWSAMGTIWRGWALAEQGKEEEGIAQMRQGLAARRALGAELWWTYYLALLAEASGKARQGEEGLSLLTETLTTVEKTGERFYEAELYRLQGELTLQQSSVQGLGSSVQKEAKAYFHKAIDIAHRQQAKSLELRAVMSLSRLWQQQGKKEEAHRMLAEIYGWFTEGFDTKDLQEAKALLEELN